ncbi:nitrate reductase molybdenum cofactor assembly chaperone [Kibdelosporangium aridum]|uniref:Nitrate reductase molybdenum cofactor assembly chaperone n=1 Tax=Kibdelosporangium aridum TaxID=2030 RepID=A0A428ZAQ5_KIBAR|nr:nitrate reductase molybdenum cofactor assembly chaperone [Kibdelosporangium aridum]RSM85145.1 nitrate reductase molybdenum cofactor assembly chaperone [Kibdelosporangium aridum]
MTERANALRIVSVVLQYPDDELLAHRPVIDDAVRSLSDGPVRDHLVEFLHWFGSVPAIDVRRHYVETFDLRRRSSLYLTYYLHGDTRRRGMALLLLKQRYRAAGLTPPETELPDFLPMVCEFAAVEGARGEAPLRQHCQGVELIRTALHDSGSRYAHVLEALITLFPPLSDEDRAAVTELMAEGPPAEDVGLAPFAPPQYMTGMEIRA